MMAFASAIDQASGTRRSGALAPDVLRVLIVEPQSADGPWHYAFSLSRALAQAGFPTALATVFPYEDLGDPGDVRLCAIGEETPRERRESTSRLRRLIGHLHKLNRLRSIVAAFRPDIVHLAQTPLGNFDFVYFGLLKRLKAGIVYTAHDPSPPDRRAKWLDLARYRAADAILVHSSSDVQTLLSAGIDRSKVTLIPHGTYLEYCRDEDTPPDHAKTRLGLPAHARVVLFFGSIALYKGLDLLIEAFATLRAQRADTYLVIAGQPLEDFSPYRRRIEELNLADRVLLDLRYIPFAEFPTYFSAADVVAFPYRWISQSGVLQFAYAYGRPVVVTEVGGLAESVAEDRTGVITTEVGAAAIAAGIAQVLDHPEDAARMGERGRALARSKYSWESVAKQIAAAYHAVRPRRLRGGVASR